MQVQGEVVALDRVVGDYPSGVARRFASMRLFPVFERTNDELVSLSLREALVTSHFITIDTAAARLFGDVSYSDLHKMFQVRYQVTEAGFSIISEPVRLEGQYVILGGPIDGVWYHWLFNWLPRLLLLKQLRPNLLVDPAVKFLVHPKALQEPFLSTLLTFGVPLERFYAADPAVDYLVEEAHLVSFCDQNKLYPGLLRDLANHLLAAFSIGASHGKAVNVFASRQSQPPARRRIHNFDQVHPVLAKHEFVDAALGSMPAREQARLFHDARIVVGAHGSDLANLLFCRPGTPAIVIESRASVHYGLHIGLEKVAEIFDLDYRLFISFTTHEPETGLTVPVWTARDYLPDPDLLDRVISAALRGCDRSSFDG